MSMGFGLFCCDCDNAGPGICYMGVYYSIVWPTSGSTTIVMQPDATLTITYVSLTSVTLELKRTSTGDVQWTDTINPNTFGSITKTGIDLIQTVVSDGSTEGSCGRTKGGSCTYIDTRPNSSFGSGTNQMAANGNFDPSSGAGGNPASNTNNSCIVDEISAAVTPLSQPGVINFFASIDIVFNNENITNPSFFGRDGAIVETSFANVALDNGTQFYGPFRPDGEPKTFGLGESVPFGGVNVVESGIVQDDWEMSHTTSGRLEAYLVGPDLKFRWYIKNEWAWKGRAGMPVAGTINAPVVNHSGSGTYTGPEVDGLECEVIRISLEYGVRSTNDFYGFDPSAVVDSYSFGIG